MKRHRSLEFWGRVRAVNWMIGGVGLIFALASLLSRQAAEQRRQRDEAYRQWGLHQLRNSPGRTISRLAFSPDGRTLVGFGSWKQPGVSLSETRAWDVRTGKRLWTDSAGGSESPIGAFLPDGSALAYIRTTVYSPNQIPYAQPTYSSDGGRWLQLTFRDTRSGRLSYARATFYRSRAPGEYTPRSIDVAPNGRAIAVALGDGVTVWDAPKNTRGRWKERWLPATSRSITRPIVSARFTHDGRQLVVLRTGQSSIDYAGVTMTAEVWDARTGARVRSFDGSLRLPGQKPVAYRNQLMAVSSDRRRLATVSHRDLTARLALWDVETGKRLRFLSAPGFSADTRFDYFQFIPELTATAAKNSGGDILSLRVRRYGSSRADCPFWITGSNRIKGELPEERFVINDNEAVSSDGRLMAQPLVRGEAHAAWLFEFGAEKPTVGMK